MARMFPSRWLLSEDRSAGKMAERKLYEALSALSQDFAVYHDVQFQVRREGSARLSDVEIDFLVTHPERGVLVLEVKAGPVEVRNREWGRADRGSWRPMSDPVVQLRDHKHDLRRFLLLDPRWRWPEFAIAGALAFPDQPRSWPSGLAEAPNELTATMPDTQQLEVWIDSCFDFHWGKVRPVGAREVGHLIHEKFNTSLPGGSDLRGIADSVTSSETFLKEVTERQLAALNGLRTNQRVFISGPAGSGKTLLAMKRATEVANEGADRVLYTCFNQPLARYVRGQLSDHPNITVLHFHKLVEQLVRRAGLQWTPPESSASSLLRREWWTEGITGLALDSLALLPDAVFDAVIVDEAQDFHPDWWTVLELLLRDAQQSFFWVFGDDNQRIYPHGDRVPNIPFKFQLTENLRNTQRIFTSFRHLVDADRTVPRGPVGEPVQWISHEVSGDPIDAAEGVISLLLESGVSAADIVILSSLGATRTRLRDWVSVAGHQLTRLDPGVVSSGLTWETVRRFKGLDAPVIVLVELEQLVSDDGPELQYVALSRARSLLVVVGTKTEIASIRLKA
jgi:hypothetical protein